MPNEETRAFDFLCTLKESTAQIVDSASKAFNEAYETMDWNQLDSDQRKSVQGWQIDLQKANGLINENNV
tara:strand:- start:58 stop:267 length:210 start_codon:yes stop_codon:yes gene_type:complete